MNLRPIIGVYVGAFACALIASCTQQSGMKSVGAGPTPTSAQDIQTVDKSMDMPAMDGTKAPAASATAVEIEK